METQASPYPTLTIGEKFKDIVRDYEFDEKFCADYLFDRGVPPKQIANLDIYIDDTSKESTNRKCSGCYTNNLLKTKPTINLIPKLTWTSEPEQGNLIRHETEHFIYDMNMRKFMPYLIANGINIAAMSMIRPTALAGTIPTLVPLITASHLFYRACKDEEVAQQAETERRLTLPDGVLKIRFDVESLRELRHTEGIVCSSNCILKQLTPGTDGIIGSCIR